MNGYSLARRSAIEAALPAVPTVLCSIVAEYAVAERHEWQRTTTTTTTTTADAITEFESHPTHTTIKHRDRGWISDPYYSFVSTNDVSTGNNRRWSIGFLKTHGQNRGWFCPGVTTAAANFTTLASRTSSDDSWLFMRSWNRVSGTEVTHAGVNYDAMLADFRIDDRSADSVWPTEAAADAAFAAEFVADRETLQVVCRFANDAGRWYILKTASTDIEFNALRPCVTISGLINATLVNID